MKCRSKWTCAKRRNRAKRLLRESFRLSRVELDAVTAKYEWVLNARRNILNVKLEKPLAEFQQIIVKVGQGVLPAKYAKEREI